MEEYAVTTEEIRWINKEDSEVIVSFRLSGRDWCELSQSRQWKAVEDFLDQRKSPQLTDGKALNAERRRGRWKNTKRIKWTVIL